MTEAIFDSSAVVTMLLQERGWQAIHNVLNNPALDAVLAGPALTEVISVARRKGNQSSGEQVWETLSALGLRVEHPNEDDLIRAAALIELSEANPGPNDATLSLGDALILSIGDRLSCAVVTRDTYWKWMADQGLITINVYVP
ncbi:MAG TPA: PIN domain-containing protein [Nocardioidaceae bacterium]|nr:PIN domain-containing protein [Nocardioidaceae bacterium]